MIILDFFLLLTVLISLAEGKVWNDFTTDVDRSLINEKLSPCRIDIERVLAWSGFLGIDDMNVCIYEALANIEVPIEAGKTISISFEKNIQHTQSHCATSTTHSFSKDDVFMLVTTSKNATISTYDSEKCKNIKSSDPEGNELKTIGQINNLTNEKPRGQINDKPDSGLVTKIQGATTTTARTTTTTTRTTHPINFGLVTVDSTTSLVNWGPVNNFTKENDIRSRSDLDENNNPSIETDKFYY